LKSLRWFYFLVWLIFVPAFVATAQNIVVCDWEIIDFPTKDALKISEMLRQKLMTRHQVISHEQMEQKINEVNLVIPPHLEIADIERLAELFQAPFIVTGLITKVEEQFTINVRLIQVPPADTLVSVTQNIQGALLEPTQTFVPVIAQQLGIHLPAVEKNRHKRWISYKLLGLGAIVSSAILSYFLWPREEATQQNSEKLPRPPKFP